MSNKLKNIDIKNRTYYFFNDMISKKKFDRSNIKVDKSHTTYKNILIFHIGCVMIKDSKYVKIYSVNPLHLNLRILDGCFEEINKTKYLTLVPTNESKEKIKENMKNCRVNQEI